MFKPACAGKAPSLILFNIFYTLEKEQFSQKNTQIIFFYQNNTPTRK